MKVGTVPQIAPQGIPDAKYQIQVESYVIRKAETLTTDFVINIPR